MKLFGMKLMTLNELPLVLLWIGVIAGLVGKNSNGSVSLAGYSICTLCFAGFCFFIARMVSNRRIRKGEITKSSLEDASRTSEAGYLALTTTQPSRSQPIRNLRLRPRIGSLVRFRICGGEAKGVVADMTGQGRFGRAMISNFSSRGANRIVRRIRDLSLGSFT
mgnify:FL=1